MNLRQELKRLTNQMSQESGWYETDDCDMQHCRNIDDPEEEEEEEEEEWIRLF